MHASACPISSWAREAACKGRGSVGAAAVVVASGGCGAVAGRRPYRDILVDLCEALQLLSARASPGRAHRSEARVKKKECVARRGAAVSAVHLPACDACFSRTWGRLSWLPASVSAQRTGLHELENASVSPPPRDRRKSCRRRWHARRSTLAVGRGSDVGPAGGPEAQGQFHRCLQRQQRT